MHSCVYSMQMCLFYASGVPGELYYARNGYVNDYALSFNLPIKTEITEIYFDWFNDHPTYLPETKVTWWRWCMHNTHLYTHARAPTHLHNTHTRTKKIYLNSFSLRLFLINEAASETDVFWIIGCWSFYVFAICSSVSCILTHTHIYQTNKRHEN